MGEGRQDSLGLLNVGTLRELFRSLQAWRALWESEGLDVITSGEHSYCLQDVEYLYSILPSLPKRQWQAIELCLVRNMKESDAAVAMGISPTNPVSMYAATGLKRILEWIANSELPGWDEILPQHLSNGNSSRSRVKLSVVSSPPPVIPPAPSPSPSLCCPRQHLYREEDVYLGDGVRCCRLCVEELFGAKALA